MVMVRGARVRDAVRTRTIDPAKSLESLACGLTTSAWRSTSMLMFAVLTNFRIVSKCTSQRMRWHVAGALRFV
jgi:hypothetical protein